MVELRDRFRALHSVRGSFRRSAIAMQFGNLNDGKSIRLKMTDNSWRRTVQILLQVEKHPNNCSSYQTCCPYLYEAVDEASTAKLPSELVEVFSDEGGFPRIVRWDVLQIVCRVISDEHAKDEYESLAAEASRTLQEMPSTLSHILPQRIRRLFQSSSPGRVVGGVWSGDMPPVSPSFERAVFRGPQAVIVDDMHIDNEVKGVHFDIALHMAGWFHLPRLMIDAPIVSTLEECPHTTLHMDLDENFIPHARSPFSLRPYVPNPGGIAYSLLFLDRIAMDTARAADIFLSWVLQEVKSVGKKDSFSGISGLGRQAVSIGPSVGIVLAKIGRTGQSFEANPAAYLSNSEEDLRWHLVSALRGGEFADATGESFRGKGKTDIHVPLGDGEVFIAECKLWKGESDARKALDQLIGYLTTRDNHTALIFFSRKAKDFSAIEESARRALTGHDLFVREVSEPENRFPQYMFRRLNDPARQFAVHLFVFDVPDNVR